MYLHIIKNNFFGLKFLNSLMRIRDRDPGWKKFVSGIRDGKNSDPGSGINIRIRNTAITAGTSA
jgi:hypothetical protein